MLKTIIIPCMSLVEIYVRFFMTSAAEKTVIEYGTLQKLQVLTLPVRQALGEVKVDEHLEERVKASLSKTR